MSAGHEHPATGTIVVPVRDGEADLDRCLDALERARPEWWPIVVVDDASVDASCAVAERHGVTVVGHPVARGPAAARNTGAAKATGDWLCFVDADCVVHEDAFCLALAILRDEPSVDALFGSYDDTPADDGLVSQFKNLHHHFVHHRSGPKAVTFWSGFGFVRRSAFVRAGGFDAERYGRPSVEDIDLGYRMTQLGSSIRVVPSVQCTHLKRWSLASAVRSDVWDRGVPWVRLLRRHRVTTLDLNLRRVNRASVVVLYATGAALILGPPGRRGAVALVGAVLLTAMNQSFYRFLLRKRGPWFAARAVALHWGYYSLNGVALVVSFGPEGQATRDPG